MAHSIVAYDCGYTEHPTGSWWCSGVLAVLLEPDPAPELGPAPRSLASMGLVSWVSLKVGVLADLMADTLPSSESE